MTDEHLKLPYQWKDKETKERLEALLSIAKTTDTRRTKLSELVYSGIFPADLKDYAQYLIHDAGNSSCNLGNYVRRELTDTATWRMMYQCLHWIQHIDVLIELADLRTNR
jgi:hypothetical protein